MAQKTYNTGLSDSPADQRPILGSGHGASATGVDRGTNIEIELIVAAIPANSTTAKINKTTQTVDIPAILSGDTPDIGSKFTMVGSVSGAVGSFSFNITQISGAPDAGAGVVGTFQTLAFSLSQKKVVLMSDGSVPDFIKFKLVINPFGGASTKLGASETYTNTLQSSINSVVMTFVTSLSASVDDSAS